MKNGAQAIVQANLASGEWHGRADVLCELRNQACLAVGLIEVVDCKLARTTKVETILQFVALLGVAQGLEPEQFHVIQPNAA